MTGPGLEGVLPDALCKRIQMRYMLPYFREGDYSAGMVAGLRAVASVLEGSELDSGGNDDFRATDDLPAWAVFLIVFLVVFVPLGVMLVGFYRSRRCPRCRAFALVLQSRNLVGQTDHYNLFEDTYRCGKCGFVVKRQSRSARSDNNNHRMGRRACGSDGFGWRTPVRAAASGGGFRTAAASAAVVPVPVGKFGIHLKTIEKNEKVIWIVVVVLVVLFISGSCSAYNRMVTAEESVNTTWADVEAQYQRRSDLIPNLVNTVKGYAAHEQATFTEVVEARAQAMSFKLDAADLTPEKLAEFQQAQQKVGSALGRLIAVAEQYPDLKANQNFLELQAQLEGTENRIAVARTRFNDATRQYNVTIRRFPANLIAGMFGFDQKAYFAAEEGAQTVPEVKF